MEAINLIFSLTGADPTGDGASNAPPGIVVVVMVAAVVLLGFILMMSVRGKIARRQADAPSPRERIELAKSRGGTQDDLRIAGSGILDTAQRLAAQLDDKAERLEQLIAEAEERIAILEAMQGAAVPPAPPAPQAPADLTAAAAEAGLMSDLDAMGVNEVHESAQLSEGNPEPGFGDKSNSGGRDPLTAAVYDLADEGHGLIEIARRLDEQVGKVELILALRGEDRGTL